MFTLRKKVNRMDTDLKKSFGYVGQDIDLVLGELDRALHRISNLEKYVTILLKDQRRSTKVGPRSGRTYTTLAGRVKALQDHLGVKFEVTPKQVIPAKIDVVKVKKASK